MLYSTTKRLDAFYHFNGNVCAVTFHFIKGNSTNGTLPYAANFKGYGLLSIICFIILAAIDFKTIQNKIQTHRKKLDVDYRDHRGNDDR